MDNDVIGCQDRQAFEAAIKTEAPPLLSHAEHGIAWKFWLAALTHRDAQLAELEGEVAVAKILPTRTVQTADYADGFMEAKRQALVHLAAITRQRDELVEAVMQFARAYEAAISEEPRTTVSTAWRAAALDDARQRLLALAARIQSAQPKGEWVDKRDEMLSIPLRDGTRLKIGECFVATDTYPFFSGGKENYNARLIWCDTSKCLYYDIYPVSDRVRGCAVGGSMDDIEWGRIDRRPTNIPEYQPKEQRDEQ